MSALPDLTEMTRQDYIMLADSLQFLEAWHHDQGGVDVSSWHGKNIYGDGGADIYVITNPVLKRSFRELEEKLA